MSDDHDFSASAMPDGIARHGIDTKIKNSVPKRVNQKIVSASDAVELVRDGDTVAVSGFVCQGCAEAVLAALGKRFDETSEPKNLTLFFGGGPGVSQPINSTKCIVSFC